MKYALGNMLNGAGGLNADQLALDLQFAADKTLTARKGPTPVFTRASSGTFVGSNGLIQSAGNNVARFDHDPVTLASRGLLIEESRTNSLIRSGEFGATAWTKINVTETLIAAPDGTTTASSFNEGTASGEHSFYGTFSSNRPVMGAVACTLSVFLRAGTRRYVLINASDFSNGVGMVVDTQTWSVTDAKSVGTGWTYTSNKLTNYGNGWYRAELTFTPPAATAVIPKFGGINASTFTTLNPSYVGTSSTFIFWGAQIEAGSFATSYIPTTTASVVRSADVCSITGAAFSGFFGSSPSEFTWNTSFNNLSTSSLATNVRAITDFANGANRRWIYGDALATNNFQGKYFEVTNNINITPVGSYPYRVAISYTPTTNFWSVNGNTVGSGVTSGALLNSVTGVQFGQLGSFHFQYIRGYKKRLPNAKLQALTV